MDLVKLHRYYDSCPSYGGITYDMRGAIKAAPDGALREGYPVFQAAKYAGPPVLPAGATVLLHAGAAANHGDAGDGGSSSICSGNGKSVLRFRYRNSHLQLTGPMKASEVLQRFSEHVAIEVRRNGTGRRQGLRVLMKTVAC